MSKFAKNLNSRAKIGKCFGLRYFWFRKGKEAFVWQREAPFLETAVKTWFLHLICSSMYYETKRD